MAAPRRVIEVAFTEEELVDLERVSRSRTEPASHVQRACILLTYRRTLSLYATGRAIGVTHQTVERCLRRASTYCQLRLPKCPRSEWSGKRSPRPMTTAAL